MKNGVFWESHILLVYVLKSLKNYSMKNKKEDNLFLF